MGLYTVKTYNFKSYDCDEVFGFNIAFAIKEFLQNTQGQILKTLEVRKWREWETLDLSVDSTEVEERRGKTKARLLKSDPCIFAGDQGKAIAKSKLCQPRYVLEATIPSDENRGVPRGHDFRAVIILWGFNNGQGGSDKARALTVYNNYLDVEAKFSHFVHDGSSTSKGSKWAVGLKRKGFILSTSFLAQICQDFKEECESSAVDEGRQINDVCKSMLSMSSKPIGVGFNVGSRFCKGGYSKARPRMLKMKKEDLRALSFAQFRDENPKGKRKDVESDNESDSEDDYSYLSQRVVAVSSKPDKFYLDKLEKTYKKRGELHIAQKPKQQKQKPATHPSQEQALVRDDDVCVHVIGLPGSLTAEEAFSAVFGIFKEPTVWKIPGTLFEVFAGKDLFYHRDQLVPVQSPLSDLSINYHGELRLSSDRMEIISHGKDFEEYNTRLREAIDKAVSTIPELAILIMESMLKGQNVENPIKPLSQDYAAEYKEAFQAACGRRDQEVYPYARRADEEGLIQELGFLPLPLQDWQMQILEDAGAYVSIRQYAEERLSTADEIPETEQPGLAFLNVCIRQLLPELEHDVSVRRYHHSTPRALHQDGHILLAQPRPCKTCLESGCSCWVGPALVRIMQEYDKDADLDKIFWIYDWEKKAAAERERQRISSQRGAQNVGAGYENDSLQVNINGADDLGEHGEVAGYAGSDGSSPDEFAETAASQGVRFEGDGSYITHSRDEIDGDGQTVKTSGSRNITQTPRKLDSQRTTPSIPAIRFRASRRSSKRRQTPVGNAVKTPATSPTIPAGSSTETVDAKTEDVEIIEALEKLLTDIPDALQESKVGNYCTLHHKLTEHTTSCISINEQIHQLQARTPSNEYQGDDNNVVEGQASRKRKRTR